jgi:uncharacterized membrane protein YeaQ/YmgE (transglycosylase-associated protein family)
MEQSIVDEDKRWVSDKFMQFVDIVFGVVVAQGFSKYSALILDPLSSPLQTFALIVVYVTTTLSWIGYHRSMHRYPYETRTTICWLRMGADFLVVSIYARLIFSIDYLGKDPSQAYLADILLGYVGMFFVYLLSGFFRIRECHDPGASKQRLLVEYLGAFIGLWIGYGWLRIWWTPVLVNFGSLVICLIIVILYRLGRHPYYAPISRH